MPRKSTQVTLVCEYCKSEYKKPLSRAKSSKYCSKECKNKLNEAIVKSKKVLNHIGFHLLGIIYRTKSNYSLALDYLNQSLKLNPLYADAYSDIGALYIEMNNLPLAIKYLQKSLEINPNKLSPNNNLGILFRKLGKLQLALKFFFKALDIDLNNSGLHFSIGQIYDELDNFEKAILHYKKSVLLDEKNGNALISLYAMYLKTFDWNSINKISSKLDNFGTKSGGVIVSSLEGYNLS